MVPELFEGFIANQPLPPPSPKAKRRWKNGTWFFFPSTSLRDREAIEVSPLQQTQEQREQLGMLTSTNSRTKRAIGHAPFDKFKNKESIGHTPFDKLWG